MWRHPRNLPRNICAGTKTDLLKEQAQDHRLPGRLGLLTISPFTQSLTEKPEDSAVLVVGSVEIYLPLAGMVDLAADKPRLEKEFKEAQSHIERLENSLAVTLPTKLPPR